MRIANLDSERSWVAEELMKRRAQDTVVRFSDDEAAALVGAQWDHVLVHARNVDPDMDQDCLRRLAQKWAADRCRRIWVYSGGYPVFDRDTGLLRLKSEQHITVVEHKVETRHAGPDRFLQLLSDLDPALAKMSSQPSPAIAWDLLLSLDVLCQGYLALVGSTDERCAEGNPVVASLRDLPSSGDLLATTRDRAQLLEQAGSLSPDKWFASAVDDLQKGGWDRKRRAAPTHPWRRFEDLSPAPAMSEPRAAADPYIKWARDGWAVSGGGDVFARARAAILELIDALLEGREPVPRNESRATGDASPAWFQAVRDAHVGLQILGRFALA